MQQEEDAWHELEIDVIFKKLNSSELGIDEKESKKRAKIFGPNTLKWKSSETAFFIFLRQLHNPIVYVLLFSTLLAFFLDKFVDGLVVFSVVILNTLIGFVQEYNAHKIIRALTSTLPHKTTVMRKGSAKLIHTSQLVPGDVITLQAGDCIAADLRLFSIKNLTCDESALTGESLPVNKNKEAVSKDTPLIERKCMAFNGTYVTSGTALGVVVATGLKTEFGKIVGLIERVAVPETPLAITIKKIAKWITLNVLIVSLGLFLIGYLRGSSLFTAAFSAIALAVAAIPEGLPAIVTIASSIGVRRMAYRQAIIRQLPAVESLGSTSVICTDKTGTLTYNEMTMQKIWTKTGYSFVSGAGYLLEGQFSSPDGISQEEIQDLLRAAILCSDATIDDGPIGDPTEIALVVAGRKIGLMEGKIREEWKRKDVVPFESEQKFMATLNISPSQKQYIFIKGAPEEVLAMCEIDQMHTHIQSMAKDGMRLLAIAKKELPSSISQLKEENLKTGFHLLGIVGMIDPPRKEVYEALRYCHEAGINVKMVTGDHPLTAEAIARDLGILDNGKVVTGKELSTFDDDMWRKSVSDIQVFARVLPEHKLKLVEVLQQLGHVVAMTGDGINDAAALKQADIGIAMGIKGTAVAKEASDMILADDNFANIEAAVKEGRRIYDNLIKSLAFILPTSLGQSLVILLAVLFFPIRKGIVFYPMSPIQILWVNLVVAVALSLPLAFEPAESNIMKRSPRKKDTPILDRFLLIKTLVVSVIMAIGTIGLFLWEYSSEMIKGTLEMTAIAEAQTIAVTAIILFQIFYLFNCRSLKSSINTNFFSNYFVFIGVGVVLIAQLAFVYSPFMNRLFKTSALDLEAWLISASVAFLIVPIIALERVIRKI